MICAEPDCTAHYACTLRAKGVVVAPSATPTRHNRRPPARHRYNNWERGVTGERRADGSFMPYLDHKGDPIRNKRYSEKRAHYEAVRAAQLAGPPTKE